MRLTEKGFHFPEVTASIDFFFLIIQYFKWGWVEIIGQISPWGTSLDYQPVTIHSGSLC